MENESSPSSDSDLGFMTSLLQLAVGARSMLREEEYDFPKPADALISTFYPILSTYILDVLLRGTDGTDGKELFCSFQSCFVDYIHRAVSAAILSKQAHDIH